MANVYLWDNQQGLIEATNCIGEIGHEHPFIVTDSQNKRDKRYENLRNYLGVQQSNLVTGSIAKITNHKSKKNYTNIELIGINNLDGLEQNKWFTKKGDKGYLYNKSTSPIEDHIIQINNIENVGYLLAYQTTGYHYLKCNDRNYFLFRNFSKLNDHIPSSLIAISGNETSIFNDIKTIDIDKVNNPYIKNFNVENEGGIFQPPLIDAGLENTTVEQEVEDIFSADIMGDFINNVKSNSNGENFENMGSVDEQENVEIKAEEENVLCIPNDKINIRDESLDNVLFQAVTGEVVQVFQSYNEEDNIITRDIGGIEYSFVKVKFTNREEKDQIIGRVAKRFVFPKSKCKYIEQPKDTVDKSKLSITGLGDKMCCDFPTIKKVTHPFTTGMRRFNANRGNGTRKHAACDLYRTKDEPIVSVAPGKVVRDLYYFYQGTYALEVVHEGGFVVRYGELTGKRIEGLKSGSSVKMGDRLGYIGVVNSNCCLPMLHFEMFKGDKKGPLSTSGNKYQRRSDLMDPTFYLQKWEGMTFND